MWYLTISINNEDNALEFANQLREILSRGGFSLAKWLSDIHKVVESSHVGHRAKEVKGVDFIEALPAEMILELF